MSMTTIELPAGGRTKDSNTSSMVYRPEFRAGGLQPDTSMILKFFAKNNNSNVGGKFLIQD